MRQVQQPLNVTTDATGSPSRLEGSRKPVNVRRVIDSWRYGGRWWVGEPPRDYYLLELKTGHVFEVYREDIGPSGPNPAGETWTLSRIAD